MTDELKRLKAARQATGTVEPIMQYFEYEHLPSKLQEISSLFHDMAWTVHMELPKSAERAAGLRKLLEAKDCFVRAALP